MPTAKSISDSVNGQLIGDPDLIIESLASIESDEANSITFFGNPRYESFIYGDRPRAILVPNSFQPKDASHITFIQVNNVYEALSTISRVFDRQSDRDQAESMSTNSVINPTAQIGSEVQIGHFTVIESHVRISENVSIGCNVTIGAHCHVGSGTIIHDGARLLNGVSVGKNCIIGPNAVIGSDGFSHALTGDGYKRISHHASVIIEDYVEIGSNTCIDRGMLKDTIIRKGSKLDNLIQVAHGVEIGEGVAIAAQTGISGSASIGNDSLIGGQVGVAGHVTIAAGSKVQAKSGISGDIKEKNKKWYGYPVLSYYNYLRSYSLFKRLPELLERIKRLENK